ncbi:MAG: hypothetical protein ABI167_06075 [Nitrosospira sp.]
MQAVTDKGDLDGALRYSEWALNILEKSFGKNHKSTKTVAANLENIKTMVGINRKYLN